MPVAVIAMHANFLSAESGVAPTVVNQKAL
jgi:hypothetical protein